MKLQISIVHILGFLVLPFKLANFQPMCSKNEYIITDPEGIKSCLKCNDCPVGTGLSPPCGTILHHPFHIDCLACVSGLTYSDEHGPGSCKPCGLCSPNELVNKTCKPERNTVCSKVCVREFYYDTNTHDCQPCSECCSNDKGSRMEECKRHDMPLAKQCSVHQRQHCRKHTSTPPPIGTTPLRTGGTQPRTTIHDSSGTQHALIAGLVTGFSVIVIVMIILIKSGRLRVPCRKRNDVVAEGAGDGARGCNRLGHDNNIALEQQGVQPVSVLNKAQAQNHDNDGALEQQGVQPVSVMNKAQAQRHDNDGALEQQGVQPVHGMSPPEGQRYKLLQELHHEIRDKLEDILAPDSANGVGNWFNLGLEYEMKNKLHQLKSNRDCKRAAQEVLDFIIAAEPRLTVCDFCKTMEKIRQNEVVDLLRDHMFTKDEQSERS